MATVKFFIPKKNTKKKVQKDLSNFDNIDISTTTVIVATNWEIDSAKLYERINITPYVTLPKKKGRKNNIVLVDPNRNVPNGSIIAKQYIDKREGISPKRNKKTTSFRSFPHCITLVMKLEDKKINFKLANNGKFQITGAKNDKHTRDCIEYTWAHLYYLNSIYEDPVCKIPHDQNPKAIIRIGMTNITFKIGYQIDRKALNNYINKNTEFSSIFEPAIRYTGAIIKKSGKQPMDSKLTILEYVRNDDNSKYFWTKREGTYKDYFDVLNEKDKKKEEKKDKNHTFLVFRSGAIIESSYDINVMRENHEKFVKILKENRNIFEEKLKTKISL